MSELHDMRISDETGFLSSLDKKRFSNSLGCVLKRHRPLGDPTRRIRSTRFSNQSKYRSSSAVYPDR